LSALKPAAKKSPPTSPAKATPKAVGKNTTPKSSARASPKLSEEEEKLVHSFLNFCSSNKFTMPKEQYQFPHPSTMSRELHVEFLTFVADAFFKSRGATNMKDCSVKVLRVMSYHAFDHVSMFFSTK
jgi:hypothetical protein